MTVENPLGNWQKRFPLPESLDNQEFRQWIVGLPIGSRRQVADDISSWWRRTERNRALLQNVLPDSELTAKVDETIGALAGLNRRRGYWSGLSLGNRGKLIRLFDGIATRRITSRSN